jgi:hypothetical protein
MHRQASEALEKTLAQAHVHHVQSTFVLFPWERFTTEPANTIQLARCKMSTGVFCLMGGKMATVPDFGLKPRKSALPLPLKRRGKADSFCQVSICTV